jgi:hypothetical protein
MSNTDRRDPGPATSLGERLLDLWAAPIADPAEARAAFEALYCDPLTINGTEIPLQALVDRAAGMHKALERTGVRLLDVVEAPGKVVIAFEMTARHIGTWHSALGDVPATNKVLTVRTIDILTLRDGLISGIWVVSDEVSLLDQLGARVREPVDSAAAR